FTAITRRADGRVGLAWELPARRRARLLAGDDPAGPWAVLPGEPLAAEGRLTLSPQAATAARFYRLELLPLEAGGP
ncbi:MAG TPA: hypothetical protein PKE47_06615, partial [Verrucomicrobiota bacterium]|nr:hypothetical protein [Verrucomicrobiota bacterium]